MSSTNPQVQLRSLGFVTAGGRLSNIPNDRLDRLESFTNGEQLFDTAFTVIKKEEDSGIFPIPVHEIDQNLPSVKKENDYGEVLFGDLYEDEYENEELEDEFPCQCADCLKKDIILISKEEYESSRRNRKQNASDVESFELVNNEYKDFMEDYVNNNEEYSTIVHRQHQRQKHTGLKVVYECTFSNCKLTFSSLKTIYVHLRIRHLQLMATRNDQRKLNQIETKLPPCFRPDTYINRTVLHLDGFLLTEDQEKPFEEIFRFTPKINLYEREKLAYKFKISEAVIVMWFQNRRNKEASKRKKEQNICQTATQPEASQMSLHSATAATQTSTLELANSSHPLPSTSSNENHLNNSAQSNSSTVKHNTLRHLLQYLHKPTKAYNSKEVTEIVNAKRENGKIKVFTFSKCNSSKLSKYFSRIFSNQSQASQSIPPISQTANIDTYSDAQHSNLYRSTSSTNNVSKTKRSQSSKNISKAENVSLDDQNSRHTGMKSSSASTRKRSNPSQQLQSSSLDSEENRSGRQSSITGPLHCSDKRDQWVSTYKIPKKVKLSNAT